MQYILLFSSLLLIHTSTNAQQANIEWQKCFGGSENDIGRFVQQTNDGGYMVAGFTRSVDGDIIENMGGYDYWIMKLDNQANIEWNKIYGGSGDDRIYCAKQTNDGGYIVAGETKSYDGDVSGFHGTGESDFWVLKLNMSGDTIWTKCFGGSDKETAWTVIQTNDSNYVVAGSADSDNGDVYGSNGGSDAWIIKLDQNGDTIWTKTYGGTDGEYISSIHELEDGGFIACGTTSSEDGDVAGNHGFVDCWILRLDQDGDTLWTKCYGGSYGDYTFSICSSNDNGYILSGSSYSYNGDIPDNNGMEDLCIAKLDSAGNIIWSKNIGGLADEFPYYVSPTGDGNYIIAGYTESNEIDVFGNHGAEDIWLVKLDEQGDTLWTKCLGGSLSDYAYSIQNTADGAYIIAGSTSSNDFDVTGNHGLYDCWVVKFLPEESDIDELHHEILINVYPNPVVEHLFFNSDQLFNYSIYSAHGKLISCGNTDNIANFQSLEKGLYIIQFYDDRNYPVKSEKIIKL